MNLPPAEAQEAQRLRDVFLRLQQSTTEPLPGLSDEDHREVLVGQLIESQRRTRYIQRLLTMQLSPIALDGTSDGFDPLKGAIIKSRAGEHDEACWLVLLSTHFGRNRRTGWRLAGDFYSRLGDGGTWDWRTTSADVIEMRGWLDTNQRALRERKHGFGNHRKYESLNAWETTGTGQVLATYVAWVGDRTHDRLYTSIAPQGLTPREQFAALYKALGPVARFGRTARFDYLTTLAKVGLVNIEADSVHLTSATGPLSGARLLLDGTTASTSRPRDLETRLSPVREALDVSYDVLEDALCNWQKSPGSFVAFRG